LAGDGRLSEDIFIGGGEVAALMRRTDWAKTPLGPVETWPEALKLSLRLLLTSKFEMWLGWGPEVAFLYNDAYRPTLGRKHPDALAQPTRRLWAEIWDDIEPRIRSVYERGEATWDRALQLILERNGYPEETYHTFSYSPIFGDGGRVEGLFCAVSEETERVISERRLSTLRKLAEGLAVSTTRDDVWRAARRGCQSNPQDLPFALGYAFAGARASLAFAVGPESGGALAPEAAPREAAGPWPLTRPLVMDVTRLEGLPTGGWRRPPRQAAVIPLAGHGGDAAAGALVVGLNPHRLYDEDYQAFLRLFAGQIASSLASADAAAAERRRTAALADAVRLRQAAAEALERANVRLAREVRTAAAERDRLRDLFQRAPGFMCLLSGPDLVFEFMNEAYLQLVGHRDLIGQPVRKALPEIAGQGFFELLDEVYATGKPFVGSGLAVDIQRTPGAPLEQRFLNLVYQPIYDADGAVSGIFAEGYDVTHQLRAEAALRALNARLEQEVQQRTQERDAVWRVSEDLFAQIDRDGRILSCNPAWGEALGYAAADLVGQSLLALVEPAAAAMLRERLAQLVEGGALRDLDLALSPRSGPPRWFSWNAVCEGERIYAAGRDVTERRQFDEQLRRAQKMEALGQLTGGVAHDFNNLLQVISGNLQLLARDVSGDARAESRVRNALAGVSRGAKLASQLLAFGRRQPLEPKVVNIGRFVQGLDEMLRRALGEEIELETVVAGGLWNTIVDPNGIENAILNLAINARDAMDGAGRLTIETSNASLDADYAAQNETNPGQYVLIAVSDTGSGIAPEVLDRVFDPFFSTKPEGRGTGLGLSMVYGFVRQSGGHIKIYSEPGQGATVRIYLPRALEPEEPLTDIRSAPARGGSESVLVVEDDDEVRETAVGLLSDLGYRVLKARDAASALSVIESGAAVDLLFTDVVMPGPLRSPEMARRAKALRPQLAVLFTSGYTENAIVHAGRLDPGVELLGKPYTREALARKVRRVLANERQRFAAQKSSGALGRPGANGVVLIVEDDELIRESTQQTIRSLGYGAVAAENAAEALRVIETREIDVLVADLRLPGASGVELAERARALRPGLPIVFATGDEAALAGTGFADAISLLKPYSVERMREALAAATRPSAASEAAG
jgi:PAS domain S-box-containing protein